MEPQSYVVLQVGARVLFPQGNGETNVWRVTVHVSGPD